MDESLFESEACTIEASYMGQPVTSEWPRWVDVEVGGLAVWPSLESAIEALEDEVSGRRRDLEGWQYRVLDACGYVVWHLDVSRPDEDGTWCEDAY